MRPPDRLALRALSSPPIPPAPPPAPPTAAPAGAPAPGATPEPPRRRWWLAWRVAVAAVGVVALSGGATAAIALNEVSRLTEALEQNKPVRVAPTGNASVK